MFTQKHAATIASKLKCRIVEGRKHTIATLYEAGRMVGSFGIRRGSREEPHDYIPKQIHLTQQQCRQLYDCTLSRENVIELLRGKNLL